VGFIAMKGYLLAQAGRQVQSAVPERQKNPFPHFVVALITGLSTCIRTAGTPLILLGMPDP
jgi:hypothetical protein